MSWDSVEAFLGTKPADDGGVFVELGRHLHGAFGGTFGGAVAAGCVHAARQSAPGLAPASLDVRFLRPLVGSAIAIPTVLHAGRSLTTVSVDVTDEDRRLVARATVGLVNLAALHPLDDLGTTCAPAVENYGDGADWHAPEGVEIPILSTLSPRVLGSGDWGVATGIRTPWTRTDTSAEAVCLAADMCVGPPVAAACEGRWIPHPNPDLSLRFAGNTESVGLTAVGRVQRIKAGLAAVTIAVWSASRLVGIGVSTSMLLSNAQRSLR